MKSTEADRNLEEEQNAQRQGQLRKGRFDLANTLGWVALSSCILWLAARPLVIVPIGLSGLSVYFILDQWRHQSRKDNLRGGHRTAFAALFLIPLVFNITLIAAAVERESRKKAAAEALALYKRASDEPTAFLWEFYESDSGVVRFDPAIDRWHPQNASIIIDKMTDSEVQFHIINNANELLLWSWASPKGAEVRPKEATFITSITEKKYTFDHVFRARDEDRIRWRYENANDSREFGWNMTFRSKLRLFQPRGWMLFKLDSLDRGRWVRLAIFDNANRGMQKADISANDINLQFLSYEGRALATLVWNRAENRGTYKLQDKSLPTSTRIMGSGPLGIDVEKSSFVNGPIYMTTDEFNPRRYVLVRY